MGTRTEADLACTLCIDLNVYEVCVLWSLVYILGSNIFFSEVAPTYRKASWAFNILESSCHSL